ncbi:hypothetical protein [Bacteroides thetaiotaomicron]|uniref:hypothetical protein n=1 Tax=Bacteroides thetaiotaomicron TaxID=818 RepID=UPI001F1AAD88|nr:hypothetical protein [Bacteroides thetaiotaomicron]MCE8953200.1 hypothetical protein [Bacteroides thetaiotaomicron]MCE8970707.1 hypothetical protein [Bacteroides thetaiotaomicron]
MKKIIYLLLVSLLILSCGMRNKKEVTQQLPVREFTKLEELCLLPYDSVLDYCDLSDDSIVDFPNLSGYTIRALSLSGSLLDTIIPCFLPKGLERLNLSNNKYKGYVNIRRCTIPSLKEVDLSYNALDSIRITEPLYRIILSHNNLVFIGLNQKNIQYLDVSYNIHLNRLVRFEPSLIDTVISEGVSGGKPLIGPISKNAGHHF